VWAYGCTIWEIITGTPPNAAKGANRQLEISLRRGAPRLTSDEYSTEAKEFLAFVLQSDPSQRPSMQEILSHPFLKDTEETYPISLLSELVAAVIRYRHEGGQRQSLLHPGGALPAGIDSDLYDREFRESWNFSSTESFFNRHSRIMDLSALASLAETDETTSKTAESSSGLKELTPIEKINFDERVRRGAEAMGGLFEQSKPAYKYTAKRDFKEIKESKRNSDLPLRGATERSSVRDTQIDLGDFDPVHYVGDAGSNFPVIRLADADTIRANRSNSRLFREANEEQLTAKPGDLEEYAVSSGDDSKRPKTMDWKFPSFTDPEPEPEGPNNRATKDWTFPKEALDDEALLAPRPTLKHAATEPAGLPADAMLSSAFSSSPPPADMTFEEPEFPRPSTASSMSSDADYDPFKFDLDVGASSMPLGLQEAHQQFDFDTNQMLVDFAYYDFGLSRSMTTASLSDHDEALFHEYANAPPVSDPLAEPLSIGPAAFPAQNTSIAGGMGASAVGGAVSSSSALGTGRRSNISVEFPEIVAPCSEAMMEGALEQVIADELERLLGDWVEGMDAVGKALGDMPDEDDGWTNNDDGEREAEEDE
jgi:serine/threonine protein kinase